MYLLNSDAKLIKNLFDHKKLKKPPPKVAQKYSKIFSALYCQTAQKEFRFQNVA